MTKLNEIDTLTIYVKRNKLSEIVGNYKAFAWEVVEQKDNDRYADIVDVTFNRPHKINNKDDLQLMQVYMEERLNEIGKIERHSQSKATILGLCNGIIGFACLVLGILFCLDVLSFLGVIAGIVLIVFGATLIILELITLPKIIKRDKRIARARLKILDEEVKTICKNAISFAGENSERD